MLLYGQTFETKQLRMISLITLNLFPWIVLVKKSETIFSVPQCSNFTIPLSIRSLTKKYLISKCFVLFPDDNLPFFIKSMLLLLSSLIIVSKSYHCPFHCWQSIINHNEFCLCRASCCIYFLFVWTRQYGAFPNHENCSSLCPFISWWPAVQLVLVPR